MKQLCPIFTLDANSWSIFLEKATEMGNYNETCAWIFTASPFTIYNRFEFFMVNNIGIDGDKIHSFRPEAKQLQKIKKQAREMCLTKVGNIHTHVYIRKDLEKIRDESRDNGLLDYYRFPSDTDLQYAKRYNDIVRGVVTVIYPKYTEGGKIVSVLFHDQYGSPIYEKLYPEIYTWRELLSNS